VIGPRFAKFTLSTQGEPHAISGADRNVQTNSGQTLTTVAYSATGSILSASVLADTGHVVPAGNSKLRVAHLAGATRDER